MLQSNGHQLSADAWRLLVEAEVDTTVRELRKNALWAEAVERDGVGALWVGGSRWPATHSCSNALNDDRQTEIEAEKNDSRLARYRKEFVSRRTLGKAGVCIGISSFAEKGDAMDDDEYAMNRIMMLESFLLLRETINGVSDPHSVDPQTILDPFLWVIRDPETTGPITRCTLVSIQRFINYGVFNLAQPTAIPAVLELANAVTHCRFEETDTASSEAVLMQILNVLSSLVLSPSGRYLTDVTICEIMESVLSMSCQMRLSEILRKTSESTLFTLVTFVFSKLNEIQQQNDYPVANDSANGEISESNNGEASMTMPSASKMLVNTARAKRLDDGETDSANPAEDGDSSGSSMSYGFGIPAIRELFRVLVELTNPRDLQYTDSMRLLALNTLQAAFQTAGAAMAEFAPLRELTLGNLSHHLMLVLQRDQPNLISPALRVLFLVFSTHRKDTKGQMELFLCQTLGRLMTPPVIERQGSQSSLRLPGGGSKGSRSSRKKPSLLSTKHSLVTGSTKATGRRRGSISASSDNVEKNINDSKRRLSVLSAQNLGEAGEGVHSSQRQQQQIPAIPPLLENDSPLTYEQELELYEDASLRKGICGRVATHETRRQLLEGLHHLLIGNETLLADLWVNYDCDMQKGNMFDFLLSLITHRAVPWPDASDMIMNEDEAFLDILVHHLIRMATRAGVEPPQGKWAELLGISSSSPSPQQASSVKEETGSDQAPLLSMTQLLDRKKHKDSMIRASQLFNNKPKDGIAYLQRIGAIASESGAEMTQQLAHFLRETPTINKKLLGEYIAKPSNMEVLQAYLQQFDFADRRLDEAMHSLLGTFRLPGESQQIERLMETFSAAYFASEPVDVATADAAFILSYAIIMLNTDQHSRQVKERMKFEDFARNLRGVNDGQDFRTGFLEDIYQAIREREIVFPEEHEGEAGFELAWREIIDLDSNTTSTGWVSTRGQTACYDGELLATTWPRLLQSLARILIYFTSDHTLRQALAGLHALIATAAHYKLSSCVNESLRLLVNMTGLTNESLRADLISPQILLRSYSRFALLDPRSPTSALGVVAENFAGAERRAKLQEQEKESFQLTQVALEFGKDYRGQVAFFALSEFVTRFAEQINRQGWMEIVDAIRVVVDADLLPSQMMNTSDLLEDNTWVPRISTLEAMDAAQERIRARLARGNQNDQQLTQQGGGLLSAISSFWGSSNSGSNGDAYGDHRYQQETTSHRQELRWRVSPEVLIDLVTRSKQAVRASSIAELSHTAGQLSDTSLSALISVLALMLPQPSPSQPGSPSEHGGNASYSADTTAVGAEDSKHKRQSSSATSPQLGKARLSNAKENLSRDDAAYSPSAVFFLEFVVSLVERNPSHSLTIWPHIERSMQRILEYADVLKGFTLERTVSGLLRAAIKVLEVGCNQEGEETSMLDVVERILRCLGLLRDVKDATFDLIATELAAGIERLVEVDAKALLSVSTNWDIIRSLLKRLAHIQEPATAMASQAGSESSSTSRRSLAILVEIVILLKCGSIGPTSVYFSDVLGIIQAYAPSDRDFLVSKTPGSSKSSQTSKETVCKPMSANDTAAKLIALLYDMQEMAKTCMTATAVDVASPTSSESDPLDHHQLLPIKAAPSVISAISTTDHSLAARQTKMTPLSMWINAMNGLTAYASISSRETRQLACSTIQRAIAAGLPNIEWTGGAFSRVLFPLMDMLLRADLLTDGSMEDTHARCISMLTMFFLHNASALQTESGKMPSAISSQPTDPFNKKLPALIEEGDKDAKDKAPSLLPTLLDRIWLRLVGILSVYLHTSKMALESRPKQAGEEAEADGSGNKVPSASQRRHLIVLGEMAEESTKNCMLVLENMGIFGTPQGNDEGGVRNALWVQSWKQLDKVRPQLREQIFPQRPTALIESNVGDNQAPEESAIAGDSKQTNNDAEAANRSPPLLSQDVGVGVDSTATIGKKEGCKDEHPLIETKKKRKQNIIIVAEKT